MRLGVGGLLFLASLLLARRRRVALRVAREVRGVVLAEIAVVVVKVGEVHGFETASRLCSVRSSSRRARAFRRRRHELREVQVVHVDLLELDKAFLLRAEDEAVRVVLHFAPSANLVPVHGLQVDALRAHLASAWHEHLRVPRTLLRGFLVRAPNLAAHLGRFRFAAAAATAADKTHGDSGVELASGRSSRPARGSTSQESTCVSFAARRPRRTA
mmetsp:Transcript_12958/g.54382  ORF Transcript_12958/g.54382 Transcript_12958/m.54382 type:complete len:215 (+) Transcript_12958:567-1211(+)